MSWLLAAVVLLILGGAAVVASGRWGAMPELVDDRAWRPVPPGPIDARALREAQFSVVTRGYSMQQVDDLLERLARQLAEADGTPSDGPLGDATQNAE
ncbi:MULTISPECIES: DivIVA domain-containing protein [unclassified Luteococcus]|uniref:DivIVA domain-containing protein n=1 Tax=unclassified Luteococcus TaxID=2639923 RepID=UPI00313D6367